MPMRSRMRSLFRPVLHRFPRLWRTLIDADTALERARHSAARHLPVLIRPDPRHIEIAITALCNQRCVGCRYGRDFMRGAQLELEIVLDLLEDARDMGAWDVRFYGGEPLLHPHLPEMIERAVALGLATHVTTNGILLRDRIDSLYAAGLRTLTIGFYGTGAEYDGYVQRKGHFARLEDGIATVRQRYGGAVSMRINWLLCRPSCNLDSLYAAVQFARKYDLSIQVDLVHYSLPYFTEGPERFLQFRAEDRPAVESVTAEILRLKDEHPGLFTQSTEGLRSIPEWLLLGPGMRVPCDSYQMLWVGADGTVQLCYVTFPLGNLHHQRLRDIVFQPQHRAAARDSFLLNCPNCHCHYDRRIHKHARSLAQYSTPRPGTGDATRAPAGRVPGSGPRSPLPVLTSSGGSPIAITPPTVED